MQLSYALLLEHNIFYIIAYTPSFVIIKKRETDDPKIDFDDHKTLKYKY